MKFKINFLAESALLLNAVIWGGTFVIIKLALDSTSPMFFISVRFALASIILFFFASRQLKKINKKQLTDGFILGFLLFLGFATQTIGLKQTTATKSAFITALFVVFTPIFQTIFEKKFPSIANIVSIILVLGGIIFLTSKGNYFGEVISEIGNSFNLGDFFTLMCAVSFAIYMVYLDIVSKKYNYKYLSFIQVLVTGLAGILFAIIFHFTNYEIINFEINYNFSVAIIYTTILATVVTLVLQTKFQKETTPTKAGIIFSFEPIFAAIFAYFLLNEKISNFGFIGSTFIICGLLISELWNKGKR